MVPHTHLVQHLPVWLRMALGLNGAVSDQRYAYLDRLKQMGELLVLRALQASEHSVSYRPFPVGCAVVGMGAHSMSMPRIFTGHNMKVGRDARVTCGEVIAIGSARQQGCLHIPLIAVVGNPQVDHGSGVQHATLHPCQRCRAEFQALSCISDQTIVITATRTAAAMLLIEAETIFGKATERIDERTGFTFYDPVMLTNDQEPVLSLDGLIGSGMAEAMSLPQLLAKHKTP